MNLLYPIADTTVLGVTLTTEADGGLHLSGTSTVEYPKRSDFQGAFRPVAPGEYTLSCRDIVEGRTLAIASINTNGAIRYLTVERPSQVRTFTLVEGQTLRVSVGVQGGQSVDDTLHVMLERGSTAHDYIPPATTDPDSDSDQSEIEGGAMT